MATLLYEELGLTATATVEEIRKAYKKRALQTHPDRLPPNATPEQKKEAEEHFRRANHAYEILTDPAKRRDYDTHGVWPPPEPSIPQPSTSRPRFNTSPFSDPLFSHRSNAFPTFAFQDPFALFDSIFGDVRRPQRSPGIFGFGLFDDPFARFDRLEREVERDFSSSFFASPFTQDPFGTAFGPPPGVGFMSPFGMLPGPSTGTRRSRTTDGSRWVSESYATQTINGITQSVHTRRDANGNEHATHSMPNGRKLYTINGVEQQSAATLPGSSIQHGRISVSETLPAHQPPTRPPPPPYVRDQPTYANAFTASPSQYPYPAEAPVLPPAESNESTRYAPQRLPAHVVHAVPTSATTAVDQERDRASHRANTHPLNPAGHDLPYQSNPSPRPGHSSRRSSHHHQNHLQTTHHKSHDPYHPNPSPYYLDDIDRDRQHSRHHHRPSGKRQ